MWPQFVFFFIFNITAYFSPNGKRNLYYPLLNDNGRSSLQMMTVRDMNSNTLILDELVLNNHEYLLEQYGDDFYLPDTGENDCRKECIGVTEDWEDFSKGIKVNGNLFAFLFHFFNILLSK